MFEALEDRRLRSATLPAYQDGNGVVYVRGTSAADAISVAEVAIGTPIGDPGTPAPAGTVGVDITPAGATSTFHADFFNVKAVVIDAGDGNDAVTGHSYTVPFVIFGGAGDDTIDMTEDNSESHANPTQPTASSLIFGNAGNDNISLTGANNDIAAGNDGNDVFTIVSGSATLLGGSGDDFFSVQTINWDPFNPATSPVTVVLADGGNGNDTLFSTLGTDVTFLGGNGNDSLIYFGGAVTFYGGNGNDTADIYATFPGLDVTNAGLTYNGGNGKDALNTDTSATSADVTTTSVETSTTGTLPPPTI